MLDLLSQYETLTARERDVMNLIVQGDEQAGRCAVWISEITANCIAATS
jgi:hypothetical protein